jgi:hypothetical protein
MPMLSYVCPDCGAEQEHFHHSRTAAPVSYVCEAVRFSDSQKQRIEHRTANPDGTETITYEEVETVPEMLICTGTAVQTETYPGQLYAANAKRFEELVVYERMGWEQMAPEVKRKLDRYYVPGRNSEPTEPGMRRIELTNMGEYNSFIRSANAHYLQQMTDHRDMHREYWKARRKALREHVDARVRHNPLWVSMLRAIRARSDAKFVKRYSKSLDPAFQAQLIERNQGNMQDWCAEDTGWKARRAR